jgi:ribosome-binding factor A
MSHGRMRRVDGAVKAVLSEAIARELSDPRIGFVTVTAVKTSPDLRHSRVYVSVLGPEREREQSLQALEAARGYLQGRIASELTLKHTPLLSFHFDPTILTAMRITQLLDEERPD